MSFRRVRRWTYGWWKPRSCKSVKTWIVKAKNILNCTHRNLCCTGHFCLPTFWDWLISNDNLDSWVFPHLIYQLCTPWYHLIEGLVCSFIASNLLFVNIVLFMSSFLIFVNFAPLGFGLQPSHPQSSHELFDIICNWRWIRKAQKKMSSSPNS